MTKLSKARDTWMARFRRLAKYYERLPRPVLGLHFVAFACLFLHRAIIVLRSSQQQHVAAAGSYLAKQSTLYLPMLSVVGPVLRGSSFRPNRCYFTH
jgi:hypothetical protein